MARIYKSFVGLPFGPGTVARGATCMFAVEPPRTLALLRIEVPFECGGAWSVCSVRTDGAEQIINGVLNSDGVHVSLPLFNAWLGRDAMPQLVSAHRLQFSLTNCGDCDMELGGVVWFRPPQQNAEEAARALTRMLMDEDGAEGAEWADASARAKALADTVPDAHVRQLLHAGIQRGEDPTTQRRLLRLTDKLLAVASTRQLAALAASLLVDVSDEHHDRIVSLLAQARDV